MKRNTTEHLGSPVGRRKLLSLLGEESLMRPQTARTTGKSGGLDPLNPLRRPRSVPSKTQEGGGEETAEIPKALGAILDEMEEIERTRVTREAAQRKQIDQKRLHQMKLNCLDTASSMFFKQSQQGGSKDQELTADHTIRILHQVGLDHFMSSEQIEKITQMSLPVKTSSFSRKSFRKLLFSLAEALQISYESLESILTQNNPDTPLFSRASSMSTSSMRKGSYVSILNHLFTPVSAKVQLISPILSPTQFHDRPRTKTPDEAFDHAAGIKPAPPPQVWHANSTINWPFPPPLGALIRSSDQFPVFRKHMREQGSKAAAARYRKFKPPKKPEDVMHADYYKPIGVGDFTCSVCRRKFLNATVLDQHMQGSAHQASLFVRKEVEQKEEDQEPIEPFTALSSGRSTPMIEEKDSELKASWRSGGQEKTYRSERHHLNEFPFWWQVIREKLLVMLHSSSADVEEIISSFVGGRDKQVPGNFRSAIVRYFISCVENGAAPNSLFLLDEDNNICTYKLKLKGCLYPRLNSVLSLSLFLHSSSWIRELVLSDNDLKASGAHYLCAALRKSANPLEVLVLGKNNIQCDALLSSHYPHTDWSKIDFLHSDLEGIEERRGQVEEGERSPRKDGRDAATEIAHLLQEKDLRVLDLSHNRLSHESIAIVAMAASHSSTLAMLDLSYNILSVPTLTVEKFFASSMERLILNCKSLTELNLSWNRIGGMAAEKIADSLYFSSSLSSCHLAWNSFGRKDVIKKLSSSLGGGSDSRCCLSFLDLSYNDVDVESATILADGLERNNSLKRILLDGNPMKASGARSLQRACVRVDHSISVSMQRCAVEVIDATFFDADEPQGPYKLDMSKEYSRKVLKSLLRLQTQKTGSFCPGMLLNDKPFKLETGRSSLNDLYESSEGSQKGKSSMPTSGILSFEFASYRRPPAGRHCGDVHTSGDQLQEASMLKLCDFFDSRKTLEETKELLEALLKGSYLSSAQAARLLRLLVDSDTRVYFACFAYLHISDSAKSNLLTNELSGFEAIRFASRIGRKRLDFTPNNPTGHYSLHLDKPHERAIALDLIYFKNLEMSFEDEDYKKSKTRKGGERVNFDRVWRNCYYNHKRHSYSNTWKLPTEGVLELDFVQISRPSTPVAVISNELVVSLCGDGWGNQKSPEEILAEVRKSSNLYFFTCKQILYIILQITKLMALRQKIKKKLDKNEIISRWSNRRLSTSFTSWRMGIILNLNRLPTLREVGILEGKSPLRVELCVIVFARVVDWNGFKPLIFEKLTSIEQRNCICKLDFGRLLNLLQTGSWRIE